MLTLPSLRAWPFYGTVLLSAFLLFFMEPMLAKGLLPLFGGSYMVWGSCMVFFQAMLLAGYAFAHFLLTSLGVRRYARAHWTLLILAALWAPLQFSPRLAVAPLPLFLEVFRRLLITAGPPFLALSTLSVVVQRWMADSSLPERKNPYVLYAASNLGSMAGLIAYPLLFEPLLDLRQQAIFWWGGYALLVALNLLCLPSLGSPASEAPAGAPATPAPPPARRRATWLLLSMAGSAMLLAVTNVVTFDIAAVPFLWVLPLAVYLLSFVLVFKRTPWIPRWSGAAFIWLTVAGLLWFLMSLLRLTLPAWGNLLLQLAVLFFVCLHCHGTLAVSRPSAPQHLSMFYFLTALGGVAGGVAVNWIAPIACAALWEFPGSFCLAALALAVAGVQSDPSATASATTSRHSAARSRNATALLCVLMVSVLVLLPAFLHGVCKAGSTVQFLVLALPFTLLLRSAAGRPWRLAALLAAAAIATGWTEGASAGTTLVEKRRNYYGIYRVFDKDGIRYLQHGSTLHGRQYLAGPSRAVPLSYYHPTTPAGSLMASPMMQSIRHIGMIGLGTGALTCYASQGQTFMVYELDPENIAIAGSCFGYLEQARANGCRLTFVEGDGRLALGRDANGSLDLLILDAFNSGSIPVHLLTLEAFREYFRVLSPEGLLLIHISNKFLNLAPVVQGSAGELGLSAAIKTNIGNVDPDADPTVWMALTRSPSVHKELLAQQWNDSAPAASGRSLWTDRYSYLIGALMQ